MGEHYITRIGGRGNLPRLTVRDSPACLIGLQVFVVCIPGIRVFALDPFAHVDSIGIGKGLYMGVGQQNTRALQGGPCTKLTEARSFLFPRKVEEGLS